MSKKPEIQHFQIESIKPYERNVKKHDKEQVTKIAQSIKEFGWTQPIVVDKDHVIIAGHGRRLAAIELGQKTVPVWVRDDLNAEQVRALRLADNRVAVSKIDTELLRLELSDLDFNLEGFFDPKELEFASADLGEINLGAFVTDVGAAAGLHELETANAVDDLKNKPVSIAKVFGFKEVRGSSQLPIGRLLAEIENRTALKGEDALVAYSKQLLME